MSISAYKTHAKHDRDSSLVYATRDDVLLLLGRLNTGDDSSDFPLSNLGDATTRDAFIDMWLQPATAKVMSIAQRDFEYHEEEQIVINGPGLNRIDLSVYGMTPLLEVSEVEVDDAVLGSDSYVISRDGWLQYSGEAVTVTEGFKTPLSRVLFPEGALNIAITATWGYDEGPPEEIVMAANLFAAAYVVNFVEAFDSNTSADIPGGNVSLSVGDMRITQWAGQSRYSKFIKTLEDMATSICRKYRPRIKIAVVTPEPKLPFADEHWQTE